MRTAFLAAGTAALSLALVAPGIASAACTTQNTYKANTTGEWQLDANWSTGTAPTSAQDACIPATSTVTLAEPGVPTAAKLTVEGTLRFRTDPGFGSTQANFGNVDNAGLIEFTSTGTGTDTTDLTIRSGGKLTNRAILRTAHTNTGVVNLVGDVDNVAGGSIQLNSSVRSSSNFVGSTWTNAGSITVATGVELQFNSGFGSTLEQTAGTFTNNGNTNFNQVADLVKVTGGTFNGTTPVLLHQGSLAVTGGSGTARIQYGNATLADDVGSGWTIRLEDRGSDTTRLKIPANTTRTNRGTLVFAKDPTATTNAVATLIDIAGGGKLINAGTIRADADGAGPQEITAAPYTPNPSYKDPAAFVQNGALQVDHDLAVPPFTQNSGTTTVASGKALAVGYYTYAVDPGLALAGGTLTGSGRVYARTVTNSGGVVAPTPGGATNLNFSWDNNGESPSGHYVQTAGGTLRIRLAATGSALSVGSDIKLGGTLDIAPTAGYTPPAGQTFAVVRNRYTPYDRHYRTGTFATVTGSYTPVYENDGVDTSIGGSASSFTIDDASVREGAIASFVVKRTNGTGSATVHWELREQGSAAAANGDYGYGTAGQSQTGDLTFAAGETQKTIAIQTFGDGSAEPDETFRIHLSHPTNVAIAKADATGTILNDDWDFQSVSPTVLPNTGPITVTLRGGGLTSRMSAKLRYISKPNEAINAVSFTPSDDGLSATAVFDTTGLTPTDGNWYVQLYAFDDTNFTYRQVSVEASTEAAKPYVQAAVPPYARGGVTSYSYLHYGNVGKGASLPAFLRFSGYPAGADLKVDHLPAGASYTLADGIAGRTVMVSVGKIAALANDYIRIGYTPTTTIPGHTKLGLQASMSFGAAVPAQTNARTFVSATPATLGAGELFASNMAFSGGGALTLRYAERAPSGGAPTVTHTGTRWTFTGDIADPAAPSAKAARAAKGDPTGGQLTVDFNGGEFKITGPLIELEGEYELSIEKLRLTECLKEKGLIGNDDYEDLKRFADGAVVLTGLTSAASAASLGYDSHLSVMKTVMSGAWEKRVLGGKIGIVDQIANPAWGFDLLQDDEYQMLWLAQLCNPKDTIPEPEYDEKGNYKPSKYIQELLQSFDPNEKYGTQGGGDMHAVRSDRRLDYTVGFQNLPSASAAAQTVTVTDTLDPAKVDMSTFALGPIAFGDQLLTPPTGVTSWTKTVDLRPGKDYLVKVEGKLTGTTATWTFTTLDPQTLAKTTDVTTGFLPPSGEGSIAYSVAPKAGVATGTAIAGSASIVFDTNAPIVTNVWSNLIDDVAPTGSVTSAKGCSGLTVTWSGADATSGVGSYDVWAAVDGGAYSPWQIGTTATSASYPATAGHTYTFDVQARDLAGNLQSANRSDALSGAVDCAQPPAEQPPVSVVPAPVVTPQPPTTTTVPPKAWLKFGKLSAKLKKNALSIPATCPATETAGCKGKLKLTTVVKKGKKKVTTTLGTASFNVKAGKRATIKLKLSKAALKLLKKGSLKTTLTAKPSVASDKRTATGSLRLAKAKKR